MKLLTNNPKKIKGIEGYGLEVVERMPIQMVANDDNLEYLQTKKNKMGHLLKFTGDAEGDFTI
jgi:3,4-dihydroxy 2-butanone 4-phosphate synthase/GTP cyclohydrolase II